MDPAKSVEFGANRIRYLLVVPVNDMSPVELASEMAKT
jgi:hypothetical protein